MGDFPCFGGFSAVICGSGFNGVHVNMCVGYAFEDLL